MNFDVNIPKDNQSFCATFSTSLNISGVGENGESAYEIAVRNGFIGTEQEWLESLKGKDGKDGHPGADGVSATHSWNGTVLTITSASGTSSSDLKGEKGDPGNDGHPGADGYTPVKGTDYWTEADKAEMVADVIAALPVYNGEVV